MSIILTPKGLEPSALKVYFETICSDHGNDGMFGFTAKHPVMMTANGSGVYSPPYNMPAYPDTLAVTANAKTYLTTVNLYNIIDITKGALTDRMLHDVIYAVEKELNQHSMGYETRSWHDLFAYLQDNCLPLKAVELQAFASLVVERQPEHKHFTCKRNIRFHVRLMTDTPDGFVFSHNWYGNNGYEFGEETGYMRKYHCKDFEYYHTDKDSYSYGMQLKDAVLVELCHFIKQHKFFHTMFPEAFDATTKG